MGGSSVFVWTLVFLSMAINFSMQQNEHMRDEALESSTANSFIERLLTYSKRNTGFPLPPRVDLVFVVDSSSQVESSHHFKSLLTFAGRVVSEFSISPSTTRVGLILCSTSAHLQFGLDQFVNRECTLKALKKARNSVARHLRGSHCSLKHSLDKIKHAVFKTKHDKAQRLVFILSVQQRYDDSQLQSAAIKLREHGAHVFLLSVGGTLDDEWISRKPLETHRLHLSNFHDLRNIVTKGKGLNQACHTKGAVYDECRRRCQCSGGRIVNCHRVRKEFTSMSMEERRLYVQTLKTVSTVQPYKHVYDQITSYHPKWFKKVHKLKYFFPWHRWYILIFENFLRQIDCRVTVPYWDWSRAVSNKSLWRASHIRDVWHPGPHALGGNGQGMDECVKTGLFSKGSWSVYFLLKDAEQSCLTRKFNSCYSKDLPKAERVRKLSNLPFHSFYHFEDKVRYYMHNNFHNAVGGVMSLEESANAPEFWFHHGYLDKLWGDWQRRGHKFKHQYYHSVKTKLPGANISGEYFIDLERQPMCVKVVQDQPIDYKELEEEFDRSVIDPKPVYKCHHKRHHKHKKKS